jgi:fumarylpyruvate hydrolase
MRATISPSPITIEVADGSGFEVRRIYCVGRNYRAHALEMGADPDREAPFFFLKPTDAIVRGDSTIQYPMHTSDYQHEIELVVAIGTGGRNIVAANAENHIFGYAVGLDMTRRDLQMSAKKAGRPWDMGKGFDESAPCGNITPIRDIGALTSGAITLEINGQLRQSSDLSLMIWNVNEVIADLSTYMYLAPGDLIYTGTPEGVGAVKSGDQLLGRIAGLRDLRIQIAVR